LEVLINRICNLSEFRDVIQLENAKIEVEPLYPMRVECRAFCDQRTLVPSYRCKCRIGC